MTVNVHVTAVLRALGVETRAQAIVAVCGERAAAARQPIETQSTIASD
jgi:DNA-binding NarL/FixJ family response regulator